jgi:GT2 family glycosyltransferase
VVPTYRRPEALRNLLQSISEQRFPLEDIEVIIVDDSGEGNLGPVVQSFAAFSRLTLLVTAHLGPAPARQTGIDKAQGFNLAFTDDDCVPDPDWLNSLAIALRQNPGCAIAGAVLNGLWRNAFSSATHLIHDYVVANWSRTELNYAGTGNVAFPADGFREIGGLDSEWSNWGGEDRDLCRRWRASGRRIIGCPAAKIAHFHALTFRQFFDQHFRYGRGAARFHRVRGHSKTGATGLQNAGFYFGLLSAGFRAGLRIGILVIVSQAATAAGLLAELVSGPGRRTYFQARQGSDNSG